MTKYKKIKKNVFHKDFNKGTRFSVCLSCGFPQIFWGKGMQRCRCKPFKQKYYSYESIEDFILKVQNIAFKLLMKNEEKEYEKMKEVNFKFVNTK